MPVPMIHRRAVPLSTTSADATPERDFDLSLDPVISLLDGITRITNLESTSAVITPTPTTFSQSDGGFITIVPVLSVSIGSGSFGSSPDASTFTLTDTNSFRSSSADFVTLAGSTSRLPTQGMTSQGGSDVPLTVFSSNYIATIVTPTRMGSLSIQVTTTTASPTSGGGNSSTITPQSTSGRNHLPSGAIATIIVPSLLILLALAVFLSRRRKRSRRDQAGWLSQRTWRPYEGYMSPRSRIFSISSNRSQSHYANEGVAILTPSPMAESERSASSIVFETSSLHQTENRTSFSSDRSTDSQYLLAYPSDSSPISVRSISPSETFAFLKPPSEDRRGSVKPSSPIIYPVGKIPVASFRLTTVVVPPIPPLPVSPPPIPVVKSSPPILGINAVRVPNPFEDPVG